MNTLRWILGGIIVMLGGGFVVLSMVAGSSRKSFGASEISPLIILLPLVAMALLLAGLIFPASKLLLPAGAVAAVALIAFCVWQFIAESATVVWFGIACLLVWLAFYWCAAWRTL